MQANIHWLIKLFVVVLGPLIGGCTTLVPTPENSAWTNLASSLRSDSPDPTAGVPLSPATWYIKVQVPGTPPALLVFGYLETHTMPPTEVWFSNEGQFIKLRSGRVVATHGLRVNWQDVVAIPNWPAWSDVTTAGSNFKRTRSALPEYDFGIQEQLRLTASAAPKAPVSSMMPGALDAKATHWRWYREEVLSSPRNPLPPALFATAIVQGTTVISYSQQCLSDSFCLHIMRWPQLEGTPQP